VGGCRGGPVRPAPPARGRDFPAAARVNSAVTDHTLDPLIHVPTRLKIVATLAALPDGDTLSFTRLQNMIGLTPGNLTIHLGKLEDAGYLASLKTRNGTTPTTTVTLTKQGRAALTAYTQALRHLLGDL
jgi:DNA-binding MarR family transcriptional regulator